MIRSFSTRLASDGAGADVVLSSFPAAGVVGCGMSGGEANAAKMRDPIMFLAPYSFGSLAVECPTRISEWEAQGDHRSLAVTHAAREDQRSQFNGCIKWRRCRLRIEP